METNTKPCWEFVMSSFARSYGVDKIRINKSFGDIASSWCNDNSIEGSKTLDEYDKYFRELYENSK